MRPILSWAASTCTAPRCAPPVIIQGHNEHLSWAFSPNQSDFADMFREDYKPANRNPKELQQPGAAQEEQRPLLHHMANWRLPGPYGRRYGNPVRARAYRCSRPMFEHRN